MEAAAFPVSKKKTAALTGTQRRKQAPRSPNSEQNGGQKTNPNKATRAYVQVEGKRKIWGTMKATSTDAVKSTITSLTNIPSDCLSFKRKYKRAATDSERVIKWWFVIGGEEKVLTQLQEQWPVVKLQVNWKLEPVFWFGNESQPSQSTMILHSEKSPPSTPPLKLHGLAPAAPATDFSAVVDPAGSSAPSSAIDVRNVANSNSSSESSVTKNSHSESLQSRPQD